MIKTLIIIALLTVVFWLMLGMNLILSLIIGTVLRFVILKFLKF